MRKAPVFTLSRGEVEIFDVVASTKRCYCTWTLDLRYTVGNDQRSAQITPGDAQAFKTSSAARSRMYSYAGGRWIRGEHLGAPAPR